MKKLFFGALFLVLLWSVVKNPDVLGFAGTGVVSKLYLVHDALGIEDKVEDPNRTAVDAFDDTASGVEGIAQTLKRTSGTIGPTILDPYVWVTVFGVIGIVVGLWNVSQNGVGGTIGKISDSANRGLRKANTSNVALLVGLLFLFFYVRSKGMFEALSTNSSWLLVVLALFALYAFRGTIGAKTQKTIMEILGWVGIIALIAFGLGALLTFLGNPTAPLTTSLSAIPVAGVPLSYVINLGGTVMSQGTGEQLMVMVGVSALVYGILSVTWKPPKKEG